MELSKQYLFKIHTEDTIRGWVRRLNLFRFCRAYGGMNNDGDDLRAVFQYRDDYDMLEFFRFAGIITIQHSKKPPEPVPGKFYRPDEMDKFPSTIDGTTWIEQPGHCLIAGQKVFVYCSRGHVQVSVHDGYDVTEAAVVRAEIVEKLLKDAPLPRVEPPLDDKHCICPRYYPEYFR